MQIPARKKWNIYGQSATTLSISVRIGPPTGFAPQSTSTQVEPMMALNIKHLLDGVSSESDTESDTNLILSNHDKDVPKS